LAANFQKQLPQIGKGKTKADLNVITIGGDRQDREEGGDVSVPESTTSKKTLLGAIAKKEATRTP